jgi:hypothetical protein
MENMCRSVNVRLICTDTKQQNWRDEQKLGPQNFEFDARVCNLAGNSSCLHQ